MAQLLKIDSNAKEVIAKIRASGGIAKEAVRKTILDVFELARKRYLTQIVPGGKRGGFYVKTPGATEPKKYSYKTRSGVRTVFIPNIYNRLRIVERTGILRHSVERQENMIKNITEDSGIFVGVFGFGGDSKGKQHAVSSEYGKKIRRRPLWKSLQYAVKRWDQILLANNRKFEKAFNG